MDAVFASIDELWPEAMWAVTYEPDKDMFNYPYLPGKKYMWGYELSGMNVALYIRHGGFAGFDSEPYQQYMNYKDHLENLRESKVQKDAVRNWNGLFWHWGWREEWLPYIMEGFEPFKEVSLRLVREGHDPTLGLQQFVHFLHPQDVRDRFSDVICEIVFLMKKLGAADIDIDRYLTRYDN